MNQGFFAFYRGFNALSYKVAASHAAKIMVFDKLEGQMHVAQASLITALGITLVTYPLDFA